MRGGGKEKNWQVDADDKLSWGGGSHLQCSMSKALETEELCGACAGIGRYMFSFAGLILGPVYLDSP